MPDFDSLESINKELERLQAQRQQLFERERVFAIQQLRSFVEKYAIQPQELGFGAAMLRGDAGPRLMGQRSGARRYVDPATGRSWGGRGARPVWLREALAAGRRLEDFLVEEVMPAAVPPALARAISAAHVDGAREARYRDPVTLKTWGGRGPHPAWLRRAIAAGRRKEEFLITPTSGHDAPSR